MEDGRDCSDTTHDSLTSHTSTECYHHEIFVHCAQINSSLSSSASTISSPFLLLPLLFYPSSPTLPPLLLVFSSPLSLLFLISSSSPLPHLLHLPSPRTLTYIPPTLGIPSLPCPVIILHYEDTAMRSPQHARPFLCSSH